MIRALTRPFSRGLAAARFTGIRFRLGMAMALALLPILILGAVQTHQGFRDEAEGRRLALELAAERSAATAKARLDGAVVLLETLRPETLALYCAPRLSALIDRLEGYDALYRYAPTGQAACASNNRSPPPATGQAWFDRLRSGERMVLTRAPAGFSDTPALIAAVRNERPLGAFDGALVAVIPLTSLRPDISDRSLPEGAQVALTDAAGRILTATDAAAFDLQEAKGVAGWVGRARRDTTSLFEGTDRSGQRRVYAGTALAGQDVFVLLSAPDPGLLSWARFNLFSSLLLPLAAWLVAFMAVMAVSERIVIRWLDYLERVAAIYARGRFSVRPVQAMNAPAEIRILARTLDELGDTIVKRDRSLTDSLAEKDALLREIHHRVKNNLQIISSLLSMQQRALTDAAARSALGDTRQRISALALIYRTLYQSEDIRRADLRDFLSDLVGQLIASQSARSPLVTSNVEADSLLIDPDKLAPLALWLVEAVSNAQKHAFAEQGGRLEVRLKVQGETSVLEVEDDGPGPSREPGAASGVGSTLMTAFARQMRGSAEVVPGPGGTGTVARLTFPTPEALSPMDPVEPLGTPRPPRR